MKPIFIGAHDVARRKVVTLQKTDYRKRYETAYRKDLKRWGGELTLERANQILTRRKRQIEEFFTRWKERPERRPISKELALRIVVKLPSDPEVEDNASNYFEKYYKINDSMQLGVISQLLYAEKLPTVRLWFHYKNYIVGGVPDGVADDYVYEFKATTLRKLEQEEVRNQSIRQATLYACAFRRPSIKIEIARFQIRKPFPIRLHDLPKPHITTTSILASDNQALSILDDFDRGFSTLL